MIGLITTVTTGSQFYAFADDSYENDKTKKELEKAEKIEKLRIKVQESDNPFKILKFEYKEKLLDLKENYKKKFKQLLQDSNSEISYDEIKKGNLDFGEKEEQIKDLKNEFKIDVKKLKWELRTKFLDLTKSQNYDEDRENKIKEKIAQLKLKFEGKIREHVDNSREDKMTNGATGSTGVTGIPSSMGSTGSTGLTGNASNIRDNQNSIENQQ